MHVHPNSKHPGSSPTASQYPELDALQEAVRWPTVERRTIVVLATQLLATRQDQRGYAYFRERAATHPDEPLFLALEGVFQARVAGQQLVFRRLAWLRDALGKLDRAVAQEPGLTTYFRGLVLAELPALLRKGAAAAADLEWVLAHQADFPTAIRRSVYRALAKAYAAQGRRGREAASEALRRSGYTSLSPDEPQFVTDAWLTAADGYHFVPPRLVEPSPGIYVAQGYDFADFAFITTADGLVAVDSSGTPAHAQAALADLRQQTGIDEPIRHVILTHAHWDHVGGLSAFLAPGEDVQVIAHANFADELRIMNETGGPVGAYFGRDDRHDWALAPNHLVAEPETLTIGGVQLNLYPARGGETDDALLIHLPTAGALFVGDVLMPQIGAPFLPEGSAEGLFDTLALIQRLTPAPRLLIHGHTGLTENIGPDALPGLDAALHEVYAQVLQAIRKGKTLVEILERNLLPSSLRAHPSAVVPFLLIRDNLIQRLHHQRTGYWKPDGEGIEPVSPAEWAAALDLLAGGRERSFVRSARALLGQGNAAVALKLIELGRQHHPTSRKLAQLRRRALDRLRERHQQLSPFKFIAYSGLASAELPPLPEDVVPRAVQRRAAAIAEPERTTSLPG